ncbi:hypothetical protein H2201_000096 [Coniosporium apollinis]|uniref:Meiotically up-regulated gene 154 protein n=1 Tax=Coniosporium apollinis TaxID=61459 RepID=A0ABQ9PBJ3_9PEZI|nr:hypothetical protein H2201_000096 [Coniosporium apollinis]
MPRLVRRAPLSERIKSYLNPWDFLLWLSEEVNDEWEERLKEWAVVIGVAMNFVFMVARANGGRAASYVGDDVFGDYEGRRGSGWLSWFATCIVWILSGFSVLNAVYTFCRKRHYRLFEASIDAPPTTPSAHRVRVDSSPLSSSPLRFLSNIITSSSAEARAHPDETRDVWELAVWDPTPICLRLFCLFSPGHVLVYFLFLPFAPFDPRPSVTVVKTIILAILLSVQLSMLHISFSQQTKDTAIISKEVLHEYDTKFVHPMLNRPVRDVGTQSGGSSVQTAEVDTYTPTTFVNRGFRTNPNPAYASQYDPDGALQEQRQHRLPRMASTPSFRTPATVNGFADPASSPATQPRTAIRQPQFRPPAQSVNHVATGASDGGSLGVYTHANSPLRKSASTNLLRADGGGGDGLKKREGSPLKRMSTPGGGDGGLNRRFAQLRGEGAPRRESGRF